MRSTKLKTLQGEISFAANGDMVSKVVSVFRYWHIRSVRRTCLGDFDRQLMPGQKTRVLSPLRHEAAAMSVEHANQSGTAAVVPPDMRPR
jgi:hypothetical protein